MKIIIFDVGNAACSIISSPNNYGMMIDCGSHSDKTNPVDLFNINKEWLGIKPFTTSIGVKYDIGLLHITHPDDDHVRNAKKIREELTPYLLRKRKYEEFPDGDSINTDYKEYINKYYRGTNPETINWRFEGNEYFQIPMETLKSDEELSLKLRNNSSILRYVKANNVSVLFAGDMEKAGWQWLINNDPSFNNIVSKGIDILIAPHHGHKSGFPSSLFEKTGNVKVVIHSKGSEANIEGTDVSSQYSDNSDGIIYQSLNDKSFWSGKVLTTRSNGNVYIAIGNGNFTIFTSKASSNHTRVS